MIFSFSVADVSFFCDYRHVLLLELLEIRRLHLRQVLGLGLGLGLGLLLVEPEVGAGRLHVVVAVAVVVVDLLPF